MTLLLVALASASTLDGLLARGELSLLETWPDGRLKMATAIGVVPAPVDEVWARLTNWGDYENWMPQVADSTLESLDGDSAIVSWTLAVVGPNISYRARYTMDPARRVITGEQISGALSGSSWTWTLEPAPGGGTLAHRAVRSNVVETNWIVRQVEDPHHTLDYGINVATGIVELRGLIKAVGG